jgi:hypothetical protein
MLPQRWQVGRTLSHLTLAREQASHEARNLRGFCSPLGPVSMVVWGGTAAIAFTAGADEGWEVKD